MVICVTHQCPNLARNFLKITNVMENLPENKHKNEFLEHAPKGPDRENLFKQHV